MIVQCCKCHKIRKGEEWVHTDSLPDGAMISHTYCTSCAQEARLELYSWQARTEIEISHFPQLFSFINHHIKKATA